MGHPVFIAVRQTERGREAKEKGKLEGFLNAMTITVYMLVSNQNAQRTF